jgi:hypothetical protein
MPYLALPFAMANIPQRGLDSLTAAQLRAEANRFRATAARNAAHPDTAASYKRVADRLEQLARQREAEADKTDPPT